MKKLYVFLFLLLSTVAFSQEDAWVYFTAKTDSQSYFDAPLKMLSQRALDRRSNQKIPLDLKDVPINKNYIALVNDLAGVTVLAKSKWLNALHVRGTLAAINSLKTYEFVSSIDFANKSLNQTGKIASTIKVKQTNKVKNQAKVKDTKVDYSYGSSSNQIQMLHGDALHQQNFTGAGIVIAVLDGGFPNVNTILPFQRLRESKRILGGYDFVYRNANFYTGSSHGTSVLSTMAGYKENELVGTAPDASYYLFITEDNLSENPVEESLWVEAAEQADSLGVDIINTSLGYFDYDKPAYNHTYSQMDGKTAFISKGAEIAFSRGMIIVASAGNSGGTSDPYIAAPADAASVLAIGAVTASETRASFSSIGPSFDGRVKPDVMAQGANTVLSDELGKISTANGTSFSSPIMAGMIACLWQAFPSKTNKEIRQLVLESANRFTTPSSQYGYGIPNFSLALSKALVVNDVSMNYFHLYPNPTKDIVFFPENFNTGKVILYTINGQKVLEKELSKTSEPISLQTLSNGMYIYRFESDAFSNSGKIVKY
jgi:subtilisin family serine protease